MDRNGIEIVVSYGARKEICTELGVAATTVYLALKCITRTKKAHAIRKRALVKHNGFIVKGTHSERKALYEELGIEMSTHSERETPYEELGIEMEKRNPENTWKTEAH